MEPMGKASRRAEVEMKEKVIRMKVVKMESRIWGTFFQSIEMKPKS